MAAASAHSPAAPLAVKQFPIRRRMRRGRRTDAIRAAAAETVLTPANLVLPVFVFDGEGEPEPIASMPGVSRLNADDALELIGKVRRLGVKMFAIFPARISASLKSDNGAEAWNPSGLVQRTVRAIHAAFPDICVITDVALDPYTKTGHDGIMGETPHGPDILNDTTVTALVKQAISQAEAGADYVAPSDMMDGRVGILREALDEAGHTDVGILAYSAKYASCFYGPFREAVGSAKAAGTTSLDKRTYQMNPANSREALLEARLDEEEGADMVMVKPAGPYLDVIRGVAERTELPVAAYQVSGEYAMLAAAGEKGWLDFDKAAMESLLAIRRAGANVILTYFAPRAAELLAKAAAVAAPGCLTASS